MIDETIGFCIKVTGSDEGPIRRKLMTGKPEDIRRERDLWKTRSEEHERFQSKKEEASELFGRQSSFKQRTREEFEEEFKQKTQDVAFGRLARREEQEKNLQKWTSELQKAAQAEEGRKEAREGTRMTEEDLISQRCQMWDRMSVRLRTTHH